MPSSNRVRAHLGRPRETRHVSALAGPSFLRYPCPVLSITGPAGNAQNQAQWFLGPSALICLSAFPGSPPIFPESRFSHEEGTNEDSEKSSPEIHPLARKAAENLRRTLFPAELSRREQEVHQQRAAVLMWNPRPETGAQLRGDGSLPAPYDLGGRKSPVGSRWGARARARGVVC